MRAASARNAAFKREESLGSFSRNARGQSFDRVQANRIRMKRALLVVALTAACLSLTVAHARAADAYALVAYDFPFALHQLESTASRIPRERARDIVSCNAGLQRDTLRRAAEALGVEARPVVRFDAAELKTTFFPNTQETVIDLFRLRLRPA